MKLVFATFNRGKAVEAGEILGPGYELLLPPDLGITDEVEETGSTLQENSLLKARSVWSALSQPNAPECASRSGQKNARPGRQHPN